MLDRRSFLTKTAMTGAAGLATAAGSTWAEQTETAPARGNRIAVSTYSYWRYRAAKLSIEECIDLAAETGFDAVEILHIQMEQESNAYLQRLKQRAFRHGLDLCGFTKLVHAFAISGDGSTIVGQGINSDGDMEAFRAVIPEPTAGLLAVVAGMLVVSARCQSSCTRRA